MEILFTKNPELRKNPDKSHPWDKWKKMLKKKKNKDIPNFHVHYYVQIFLQKEGHMAKSVSVFISRRGTVPPKERRLTSIFGKYENGSFLHKKTKKKSDVG